MPLQFRIQPPVINPQKDTSHGRGKQKPSICPVTSRVANFCLISLIDPDSKNLAGRPAESCVGECQQLDRMGYKYLIIPRNHLPMFKAMARPTDAVLKTLELVHVRYATRSTKRGRNIPEPFRIFCGRRHRLRQPSQQRGNASKSTS